MTMAKRLNVIDLFCGCGGMTQGLKETCNVLCGIDNDPCLIQSYAKNHSNLTICRDLAEFPPNELSPFLGGKIVDIIVGSLPSGNFINSNMAESSVHCDNILYVEFHRYLMHFRPKVFILEMSYSVSRVINCDTNEFLIDNIMNIMNIGYNAKLYKLNMSSFGIPHNKQKAVIIGYRKDLNITMIPDLKLSSKICTVADILVNYSDIDRTAFLKTMELKRANTKCRVLDPNKPMTPISASYHKNSKLVYYDEKHIRRLMHVELKRIKSIPDNYILLGSKLNVVKQISLATEPKMAKHLYEFVLDVLKNNKYYI